MATAIMYRQCRLEKHAGNARLERMSWLPQKYAIVGGVVQLKEVDSTWSDGWKVVSASGPLLDEKYVVNMSHAYTRQRRASDI